jgi:hypothetical protein
MSWNEIVPSALEQLGKVFSIIDKSVTDKDKANELKLEMVKTIAGTKLFEIVMAANFVLLTAMTILDREPPLWSLIVFLLWAAAPIANTLSKEVIALVFRVVDETKEWWVNRRKEKQEEKK